MDLNVLLIAALLAGLLLWLWRRLRRTDDEDIGPRSARSDAVDTVAGWPPEATRVLTLAERKAYTMLFSALPEHLILAQVPLARFIRVPTRHSYHEWMRRAGQLCADLVVCDKGSQVIAVVEVRRPPVRESERALRRHRRMDRVLRKAGIRVIEWNEEALPHVSAVREQILPTPNNPLSPSGAGMGQPAGATVPGAGVTAAAGWALPTQTAPASAARPVVAAAAASAGVAAAANAYKKPAVVEEDLPPVDFVLEEDTISEATYPDEEQPPADPSPSTWLDQFDSGPTPLHPDRKR